MLPRIALFVTMQRLRKVISFSFSHYNFNPTLQILACNVPRQASTISGTLWHREKGKISSCLAVLCWIPLIFLINVFHHNVFQTMRHCMEPQNQWDFWTPELLSICEELHLPSITSTLLLIETLSLEEKG